MPKGSFLRLDVKARVRVRVKSLMSWARAWTAWRGYEEIKKQVKTSKN